MNKIDIVTTNDLGRGIELVDGKVVADSHKLVDLLGVPITANPYYLELTLADGTVVYIASIIKQVDTPQPVDTPNDTPKTMADRFDPYIGYLEYPSISEGFIHIVDRNGNADFNDSVREVTYGFGRSNSPMVSLPKQRFPGSNIRYDAYINYTDGSYTMIQGIYTADDYSFDTYYPASGVSSGSMRLPKNSAYISNKVIKFSVSGGGSYDFDPTTGILRWSRNDVTQPIYIDIEHSYTGIDKDVHFITVVSTISIGY